MGRAKRIKFSKEEKDIIVAGIKYVEATKIPKTRLAWSLAGLFGKQDSMVYHQICEIARVVRELGEGAVDEHSTGIEIAEEELTSVDESLDKRIGDIVLATVVVVKTYGALCVVEGTTRTLLLHISEIADEYIDDVNNYVNVGEEILAMLIASTEGRLALSARRAGGLRKRDMVV